MTNAIAPIAPSTTATTVSAYWRMASTSARRAAADRPALVVTGVFYLMVTGVLAGLWSVAADANGGSIVGYSSVALVWYVAMTESGTIGVPQRLIEEIGDDITSGRIESELLRPASLLWLRVVGRVGATMPRLAICLTLGTAFALGVGGAPPNPAALPLALVSIVVAIVVNLVVQHLVGAAAFWVRESKSAWFIYQKFVFILGGMLLPIEVLPDGVETVARYLPFMAMAYAPARLAAGFFEPELILVQLGWLVVMAVAATWVYARGERTVLEGRT